MKTVLKSWKLLHPRQRLILGILAAGRAFANTLDVAAIALIGLVASMAIGATTVIPFLEFIEPEAQILGGFAICAALFLAKTALSLFLARFTALFLAKIETDFSLNLARNFFSGTLTDLRNRSKSETEWAILRSTNIAVSSVLNSALSLFADATLTVMIFSFLFITSWQLAIAAALYFSLILLLFQLVSQRTLRNSGSNFADGSVQVIRTISDMISAFKEIKVLSLTPRYLAALKQHRTKVARGTALYIYVSSLPRLIVELGLIFGAFGLVAFQYAFGDGVEDLAVLGVFLVGSLRMVSALLPLQRAFMQLRYDAPAASEAQELLAPISKAGVEKPEGVSETVSDASRVSDGGLAISLRNVSFRYPDSTSESAAIENLSLEIPAGSFTAFIGPSGAGKSTLVDLILGLHNPISGNVLVDGVSPGEIRQASPGRIAYVPQKPGLVSGTLQENIALGVPGGLVEQESLNQAIVGAGLSDVIAGLPGGVLSSVGSHADSLSGGQIQRIGLARALYTKPSLLVLDEATSALDAETEADLIANLSALRGATTIIVIAHRLSTIQQADEIHIVAGGTIEESGSFSRLRKTNSTVKKYIELLSLGE